VQVPIHPSTTDVFQRDDLLFPHSLPEFQRLFPDDLACAAYWRGRDGATVSSALTVRQRESLFDLPIVRLCCVAEDAGRMLV
jgi:hypothetical protein